LVQVPIYLTNDIEQLARIMNERDIEIAKAEVAGTGIHWNVRENRRDRGTGCWREREREREEEEEECLNHQ
jgi:hypothetical protein